MNRISTIGIAAVLSFGLTACGDNRIEQIRDLAEALCGFRPTVESVADLLDLNWPEPGEGGIIQQIVDAICEQVNPDGAVARAVVPGNVIVNGVEVERDD